MVFKFQEVDFDQQEALKYRPGTRVELKSCPGAVDIVAAYDPMMVPPIWLVNDPKPRYPEELTLLPRQVASGRWLKSVAHRQGRRSGANGRDRQTQLQSMGHRA
jgi:hypothetical protein